MSNSEVNSFGSPWPHRWAVALACATFPLVWVGGLVTTTKAGMAVPDWPNTYGYNLFLYPWQTWLAGPWDLFVEHGHRMLAATVGIMTICLLVALLRLESRRWVQGLGFAALGLVIFQGALGGMRVLLDERTLAMLHGMTGPLFFALTVSLVVFTSRRWKSMSDPFAAERSWGLGDQRYAGGIQLLATVTAVLAYLQIVFGAVLRHVPVDSQPTAFILAVRFHLVLAAVLTIHVVALVWTVLSGRSYTRPLRTLACVLGGLIIVQLALGAATWVVKFSVPEWASGWISNSSVAIQDGGWLQTHTITAHVATGSLMLGTSVALALLAYRLPMPAPAGNQMGATKLEAAV